MIAIQGGKIFTCENNEVFQDGTILINDQGKIEEIGYRIDIPKGTKIYNAEGAYIYPGFVEPHSHIGMVEEAIGYEGEDENERSGPIQPELRGIDGCNPMDPMFQDALKAGVTTVVTGPGSANVVGGTFFAMKTYGKCIDHMIIKNPTAMKIAFGENPKKVYGKNRDALPMTRMGIAALLRKLLLESQGYMEKRKRAVGGIGKDFRLEAMLPVMKKEIPLKAHAHRADDIFTAIRIAKEFDVDLTLDHCTDGHLIIEELKKYRIPCIIGPTFGAKSKFELKNKSFQTAGLLGKANIPFAIMTDCPVIPQDQLPLCAALAVKDGCDPYDAINAITIRGAEFSGIEDRVGSLAPGKDGDVVIYRGNFLKEIDAYVEATFIEGKIVYQKEQEKI
ncbi:MAG: amidohydrolase [Tissierellia bacterium]|nr:amidohydrolase [Tissierellia bacterium]